MTFYRYSSLIYALAHLLPRRRGRDRALDITRRCRYVAEFRSVPWVMCPGVCTRSEGTRNHSEGREWRAALGYAP